MNSFIFELAAKYLRPLLLAFSLFVLFRGHNAPGGGFIGGLLAGSGFFLYAMAFGIEKGRKKLISQPFISLMIGFILVFTSATAGLLTGNPLLTGLWTTISLAFIDLKVGTPLLFDIGVYFIVTGVTVIITFLILEELQWK